MSRWRRAIRRWCALAAIVLGTCLPAAATLPEGTVAHGPFEIVAGIRKVSTGTFPNQGGNPFARREISEFQVRFKGRPVAAPGGNRSFWRVLRLAGAPRPTLLLVTTDFVLATQDAAGELQLQPIRSDSASLAELQWLDAVDGQPGPPMSFGIEAVADLQAGTLLQGGRWLRFGSRGVMDVATLTLHAVEPWVPIVPGKPITSLSREGDRVRAFSPGRGAYVLAAAGIDYASPDQGDAYGLLVVDIAQGTAEELRVDRRRFRFAETEDIDGNWIAHHFVWHRDATGREQLRPRDRFEPWAWRSTLQATRPGNWQLTVPRIDPKFVAVLRSVLQAQPGMQVDTTRHGSGLRVTVDGCSVEGQFFGADDPDAANRRVQFWPASGAPGTPPPACEAAARRLKAAIDAELATGRHDGLIKFD